jgi:hypothetical protein
MIVSSGDPVASGLVEVAVTVVFAGSGALVNVMLAVLERSVEPIVTGTLIEPSGEEERTWKVATPLAFVVADGGTTVMEGQLEVFSETVSPSSAWFPPSTAVTVTVVTPCPSPTMVGGLADTVEFVADTEPVMNETTGCWLELVRLSPSVSSVAVYVTVSTLESLTEKYAFPLQSVVPAAGIGQPSRFSSVVSLEGGDTAVIVELVPEFPATLTTLPISALPSASTSVTLIVAAAEPLASTSADSAPSTLTVLFDDEVRPGRKSTIGTFGESAGKYSLGST